MKKLEELSNNYEESQQMLLIFKILFKHKYKVIQTCGIYLSKTRKATYN